jgi:hypothetical protein
MSRADDDQRISLYGRVHYLSPFLDYFLSNNQITFRN